MGAPNDRVRAKQVAQVLERLKQGPASTIELREGLGIEAPAARIYDLRRAGHEIDTLCAQTIDYLGRPHRSARYVLIREVA